MAAIGGSGKGIQIVVGTEYSDKDLKRAQSDLNKLRAQADKSAGGLKAFGAEMKRSISTGSVIAAAAVTAFAAKSVQAFSEVQDATDALTATFGASGDQLVNWANTSALAVNLSKREALSATQTFAIFAKAAGLSGEALVNFSTSLTLRAAEVASYFGGTTAEAIEAFGSALRGEFNPIEKYGVLLNDATMRIKAMEMGLIETTSKALTPQQKVLVGYAAILEQTSDAQGDVERTSDSMANQLKRARAQFDDFQVAVGETVALALAPLLERLNGALGFFNALPAPLKTTAVAITAIGAAALIVVPKILAVRTAFIQMQTAAVASESKSSLALMGISKAAGRATIALAAVAVAGQTWASTNEEGQAFTLDSAYATDEYGRALRDIIQPGAGGSFGNVIAGITDALVPHNTELDDAKARVADFDKQLVEMVSSGDAEGAKRLYEDLAAGASEYGASTDEVLALLPGYTEALEQSADAVALAGESSSTAAPKIDILTAAQKRAKRAATGLSNALDGVDAALARQAAMQGYRDAMAEYVANPTQETAAAVIAAMTDAADSLEKPKKQAKFVDQAITGVKKIAQDADLRLKPYLEDSLARAQAKAQKVTDTIRAIPTAITVDIYYKQHNRQIPDPVDTKATGGLVTGRSGGPREDNIPFMLSRGEFIMQASSVKKFGAPFFELLNEGVNPLAGMSVPSSAPGSGGLTINGGITVQAAPGERAETSLPRALRRASFLAGVNG